MHEMRRTVMVIGGAGFIGAYLSEMLMGRGDKVVLFDVKQPSPEMAFVLAQSGQCYEFAEGSCTRLSDLIAAIKRYEVRDIVHLAALQDVDYANAHPLAAYELNLHGTLNVLEAARLLDLGRILIGSTTGVYAARVNEPMDEDHPIHSSKAGHPVGHYGASKAAADIAMLAYHSANYVDCVGIRLSNVYGFGMWAHMYLRPAIDNLIEGLPTRFETGSDALFDYTYVKDAARGLALGLDADSKALTQRIFLVGQGKLQSGADAIRILRQLEPSLEFEIGPGMTRNQQKFFRTRLDIGKAREQLGYQPEFDLKRGIQDYIAMRRSYESSRNTS